MMSRMPQIVLGATEQRLRNVLVSFATIYSSQIGQTVTLRFAGGWVRDKLLGRESHDIDVAVDVVTGEKFATALQSHLKANAGENDLKSHSVHTIASNPEKSKHLESATTRILGLDIDFVHLRSEKYTAGSRIPVVEFGTPEEDALRRDATLNALFYNLQTETIEDFTGRGIEDLQNKVLRTPLNAVTTFSDDPLRIMRLLRFSSQLGFTIAPDAEEAMAMPALQQELREKVSAERIGIELLKLVEGKHVTQGLKFLEKTGLAPAVFQVIEPWRLLDKQAPAFENLLARIQQTEAILPTLQFQDLPVNDLWLATILTEYYGFECALQNKKPVKRLDAVATIVGESIKLSRTHSKLVSAMVAHADEVAACDPDGDRASVGMLVRTLKESWLPILAFSACKYGDVARIERLKRRIYDESLEEAYNERALVNGGDIIKKYPETRKNAALKQHLVDELYKKQFNGEITTVDEAWAFIDQEAAGSL